MKLTKNRKLEPYQQLVVDALKGIHKHSHENTIFFNTRKCPFCEDSWMDRMWVKYPFPCTFAVWQCTCTFAHLCVEGFEEGYGEVFMLNQAPDLETHKKKVVVKRFQYALDTPWQFVMNAIKEKAALEKADEMLRGGIHAKQCTICGANAYLAKNGSYFQCSSHWAHVADNTTGIFSNCSIPVVEQPNKVITTGKPYPQVVMDALKDVQTTLEKANKEYLWYVPDGANWKLEQPDKVLMKKQKKDVLPNPRSTFGKMIKAKLDKLK